MPYSGASDDCEGRAFAIANGAIEPTEEAISMNNWIVNLGDGQRIPLEDLLVEEHELVEAATNKTAARRLSRSLAGALEDQRLPKMLRTHIEGLREALNRAWPNLAEENAAEGYADDMVEAPSEYVPWGVTSFAALDVVQDAQRAANQIATRTDQFVQMIRYVMDEDGDDKVAALRNLTEEFIAVLGIEVEELPVAEGLTESLAESDGQIMGLVEADAAVADAPLLLMDVQIIEPGWGNAKDNHYYPREMLRRDARVFEGVKMYATDHKETEKSVRTEVSQILECPVRFTETGAPVARVAVYDPDFDFSIRARDKAGKLGDLQCSILADGEVKEGFELGDRKGKSVERITLAKSVDWVTRAGAGGKALALVESDEGARDMAKNETEEIIVEDEELNEEETHEEAIAETEATPGPSAAEVVTALLESDLPKAVQKRLAAAEYATSDALAEAIVGAKSEVESVKQELGETSRAGRPFGATTVAESAQPEEEEKPLVERERAILSKYGIGG